MATGMCYRPLSDMESNGVYFDRAEDLLDALPQLCEYSGLPSVASYNIKNSFYDKPIGIIPLGFIFI